MTTAPGDQHDSGSSFDEGTDTSQAVLRSKAVDEVRAETEIERLREQVGQLQRENRLAQKVANGAVSAAVAQVAVVDTGFFVDGFADNWQVPAGAISAWLGATVVQVFAVVLVVARYLFPERGRAR